MAERKAKVKLPTGQEVDAFEVPIDESSERWSEFKLEDGTIFRVKMSVALMAFQTHYTKKSAFTRLRTEWRVTRLVSLLMENG